MSIDPFGKTDRLDRGTQEALVTRFEARHDEWLVTRIQVFGSPAPRVQPFRAAVSCAPGYISAISEAYCPVTT